MQFDATGSILKGWITKSNDFASNPQFNYNISDDSIRFYSGKAGISVRTSTSSSNLQTFIDAVKIKIVTISKVFGSNDGLQYAYTGADGGHYWNLKTEVDIEGVGNWLLANKGYLVRICIAKEFYVQINSETNQLITSIVTYDAWIITKSDTYNYLHMENYTIDGESSDDEYEPLLNGIYDILDTDPVLSGALIGLATALGIALIGYGISMYQSAKYWLIVKVTITELGAAYFGVAAGGPYYLCIATFNYLLGIAGITLICIGVIIITLLLVYIIYGLCN